MCDVHEQLHNKSTHSPLHGSCSDYSLNSRLFLIQCLDWIWRFWPENKSSHLTFQLQINSISFQWKKASLGWETYMTLHKNIGKCLVIFCIFLLFFPTLDQIRLPYFPTPAQDLSHLLIFIFPDTAHSFLSHSQASHPKPLNMFAVHFYFLTSDLFSFQRLFLMLLFSQCVSLHSRCVWPLVLPGRQLRSVGTSWSTVSHFLY